MREKHRPEGSAEELRFDKATGRVTCHEGGKEVGQLQLSFTRSNRAVIVDIGVSREYRGKGIGTKLTAEAERVARESGATEIGAIAQPEYLRLLRGRGFKEDGFFATKPLRTR